ncbi:MAG TPA: plastocyanin/azurin family copper-binding protein [Acidimicrobiia bacterium]|nr:plastocyanin/azurin family copper-binding protein [Acidimicrobiia bacterium]
MKIRLFALALAGVAIFAACGGPDEGGESIEGQDVEVAMFDNRFEYTEIRIPVGGTVNWVGAGANPHNAVEADGLWSTETAFGTLDQFEGDEALLTYDQPGEYVFFCTYHGNSDGDGMAGTLIVGDG